MYGEILIIVVLILANAFFAGAEIAIVALRTSRAQELASEGARGARAALALKEQPERFLATVQVGMTVVSATAAAFGGASIAAKLEPVIAQVPSLAKHAGAIALGLVIAAISFLSIVIGELVPKSLGLRAAERAALFVARPLLTLSGIARPLVWLLVSTANLILKPFGDSTSFSEGQHSVQELQQLVDQAKQAGSVDPEAAEIATRALDLPELTVFDVMVPRGEVITLAATASTEELQRILLEHSHSRLPVYRDTVDNVIGYISVKDMLAVAWERELVVLNDIIRPAFFVPESKKAVELLRDMRARHMPFAVVVDEHGGMSGIVTMEDVLEELVGQMFSEHDPDTEEPVKWDADGWATAEGSTPIRDVNRAIRDGNRAVDIELPDDGDWSTLAGLVLAIAGHIPVVGESFQLPNGIELVVAAASDRHIESVRLRVPPEPPTEQPNEGLLS